MFSVFGESRFAVPPPELLKLAAVIIPEGALTPPTLIYGDPVRSVATVATPAFEAYVATPVFVA